MSNVESRTPNSAKDAIDTTGKSVSHSSVVVLLKSSESESKMIAESEVSIKKQKAPIGSTNGGNIYQTPSKVIRSSPSLIGGMLGTLGAKVSHVENKSRAQTAFPLPFQRKGAVSIFQRCDGGMRSVEFESVDEHGVVVPHYGHEYYYVGIIDILMLYSIRKRMEHYYKAFRYDDNSISSIDPHRYSIRFQEIFNSEAH